MKNQKTYENKGKKYLEREKETILELFQEGHSMKDIARMQDRTIRSIECVIHEQIRSSIILTDEDTRRVQVLLGVVSHFVHHPLSKEVAERFQDQIQWGIMEYGEFELDEVLEFLLVESQLLREEIRLQKAVRNNPTCQETDEGVKLIKQYTGEVANPLSYYMTIRGLKESVSKLKRYRDNILGKS